MLRRDLTPTGEIQFESRPCVRGGLSNAWTILPVETLVKVQCVRVTSYCSSWLNEICFGSKTPSTASTTVIQWAVDHCRDLIRMSLGHDSDDEEPVGEDISADALAVLQDSDEDKEDVVDEPTEKGKAEIWKDDLPNKRITKTSWTSVTTAQGPVMLHVKKSGNFIYVRSDDDSIKNFIELVISFKQQRKKSDGRVVFPAGSLFGGVVPEVLLRQPDDGKIQFDFRRVAWRVRYRENDEQRKGKTSTDGLLVPLSKGDGSQLTPEQFQSGMKERLVKARKTWNRLDKSTAARLEVS